MGEHGAGVGGDQIVEAAEEEERRESHSLIGRAGGFMRSSAILIASVVALLTSAGAFFKPQDHSVTQASYEELSKSLQALTDQQQKNHDDLVALRAYMVMRANDQYYVPNLPSAASTGGGEPPKPIPVVRVAPPSPTTSASAPPPPPPPLHVVTELHQPPSFTTLMKSRGM